MKTTTDLVPVPTGASHVRPQYSIINERRMQQYQPWSPETSQLPLVSNSHAK
jgi:hypothetical protein